MRRSDYYNFEFPLYPYFNAFYGDYSPSLKYRGEYLNGNWYLKYQLNGNSVAFVPKDSWLIPGRRYLGWLIQKDPEFTGYLYTLFLSVIPLTEKLDAMNREDIANGKVRPKEEFYGDYIEVWSKVIAFGYPLDVALDEYMKEHSVDPNALPSYGNSFIRQEECDLKRIAENPDPKEREELLKSHAVKYSYVLSNYTGYHPATVEYFRSRLNGVKNKEVALIANPLSKKPETVEEWIGFATHIRDMRKRCNMIFNGMADRYLKNECKKLGLKYEDAVMLTPREFEDQKSGTLRSFDGLRYMEVTNHGQIDLDERVWKSLVTEVESQEVKGTVASRGKAQGRARIVYGPDDFHKMNKGDVLVASMTRPDFAPILHGAAAIVTNEGGITCHAAIISREMKIPCVIGTGNATEILKDDDLVEVDAERGIVTKL